MKTQTGFSLVELMISLSIGLIISASVMQVLSSTKVTERLNRALASAQENGRFIVTRLRSELLMTGRYDPTSPNLSTIVDIVDEASFVQNRPVPLPGDFSDNLTLGAAQGVSGGSDTLVVGFQGTRDCRGYKLGYADNEEFYVVNRFYVDGTRLKCQGFDGRVLRGQKVAVGNNNDAAFTLLDDVISFQVLYGITNNTTANNTGRPIRYVTADVLAAQRALGSTVVAIRSAILVKGDSDIIIDPIPSFKLLNESQITPTENGMYKMFESTVTLRNIKNFTRNIKV